MVVDLCNCFLIAVAVAAAEAAAAARRGGGWRRAAAAVRRQLAAACQTSAARAEVGLTNFLMQMCQTSGIQIKAWTFCVPS